MRHLSALVARPSKPFRLDLAVAVALTVVGELEVLLGPGEGSRLVSALALPIATLPLVWRRALPLPALATLALALLIQAPLDGFLVGQPLTPLAAIVLALYSAGRYVGGANRLARAVVAMAALVATRIFFDPSVHTLGDAVLTLIVVPLPLLVGRSVRGQALLQRELEEKAERLARERGRDTRHAAEEERVRIAEDLQAAVADGLRVIVGQAQELPSRLVAQDHAAARRLLARIAGTAREALADVRRVLGVLRRDGQARPLAPPLTDPMVELGAGADTAALDPAPGAGTETAAGVAGPPSASARRWPISLAGPRGPWLDRVLVATLLVGTEIELVATESGGARLIAALTAVTIVGPLVWRRRRPVTVAFAVLGAVSIQSTVLSLDSFPVSDIAALICVTYAIGAYAAPGRAVAGLLLLVLGTAVHAAVFYPDSVAPAVLGGAAVPWIVGRIVRGRRLLTHELREKAARIEIARAREAQAAIMAERMRVARELHDVVAHNISVIAIQAGGADAIVERDPERAAHCVALIEAVGREALAELGRLLGALSSHGGDSTAPQPSLARVEGLAQRARDSGLPVDLRVEGKPAELPPGVDLATYRIVQEALANTAKHAGDARAWVIVRYEERAVEVEVGDDGRGPNGAQPVRNGGGHGLVGMRERVGLYGGTLDVGRGESGGFVVRARLPIGQT